MFVLSIAYHHMIDWNIDCDILANKHVHYCRLLFCMVQGQTSNLFMLLYCYRYTFAQGILICWACKIWINNVPKKKIMTDGQFSQHYFYSHLYVHPSVCLMVALTWLWLSHFTIKHPQGTFVFCEHSNFFFYSTLFICTISSHSLFL